MSRSLTIGGTERADLTRLETFSFQESAYRGEAGQGGFDVDSEAGAVSVGAWKDVLAIDSDAGRFFTGQTIDRGVGRGPFTTDADARWDVQVVDINTIMDDPLLRFSGWNRPAETDVARMQYLVAWLNGEGYVLGDDYLSTADAENMDAQDYRKQGVYPRSVADECAENSGKNWYLFYDVGVTDQLQVWYGREALTTRTSAYSISSVLEDIDDYGVTWPAEWVEESGMQRDPSRVYSAVQVVFGDPPKSQYNDRPATEAAFKRREAILFDSSVKTYTSASKLAEHYLDAAETEDITITVAVTVPTTHVNAFLQGQRIAVRFPHLGYDTPTYMRCRTRTVEPAGEESKAPDRYRVTLLLKPDVKTTRFGGRPTGDVPGQGDNPSPPTTPPPAETEPGTCVVAQAYRVTEYVDPSGTYAATFAIDFTSGQVGSWVYYNEAYTVTGCPLGGGGWSGWTDVETWFQFTVPADDPTYLGLSGVLDLTATTIAGTPGGYQGPMEYGFYPGAAAALPNQGTVLGTAAPGTLVPFYVPRSLVNWSGTACLFIRNAWDCERDAFYCNALAAFNSPLDDGRGASGQWQGFSILSNDICTLGWVAGTAGSSGWVAGIGDVDGVNATFTLIGWSGLGTVEASINGLVQPGSELTPDTGAGTVTFTQAPAAGSQPLFLYQVSA